MEFWVCPQCGEKVLGSLDVVLVLANTHRCSARPTPRARVTQCLDCLSSPTGVCARHALAARQMPDSVTWSPDSLSG